MWTITEKQYTNEDGESYTGYGVEFGKCLGLVHTRRIHENVLRIALGEHAVYAVSRSLRLLADYGYLLADQQVGERGFSGVCAPGYCNECVLSHYLSSL